MGRAASRTKTTPSVRVISPDRIAMAKRVRHVGLPARPSSSFFCPPAGPHWPSSDLLAITTQDGGRSAPVRAVTVSPCFAYRWWFSHAGFAKPSFIIRVTGKEEQHKCKSQICT